MRYSSAPTARMSGVTLEVRNATDDDAAGIVAIYNELVDTTTIAWTEDHDTVDNLLNVLEKKRGAGHPMLVAVDSDAPNDVLGVATYGEFRDSVRWPGYRFTVEHSIHVTTDAWGKGVGRQLMTRLFEHAVGHGVHVMVGALDGDNANSVRFHERLGFVEVGRMPEIGWKHGRWCDLVLVQRVLDDQPRR